MDNKRPSKRYEWMETIEIERVDDGSGSEHQGSSNTSTRGENEGSSLNMPMLHKQRTESSHENTSDGESQTSEPLAGVAIIDLDCRTRRGKNDTSRRNDYSRNNSNNAVEGQGALTQPPDDQTSRRRQYMKWFAICFLATIVIVAAIVGGVCGSGKCPKGREESARAAFLKLDPTLYNDICERAAGPLTIGKIPSIGLLKDVSFLSTLPSCHSSSTSRGRWFKITGGDEVIRASTCNRGANFTTTVDTIVSIFQGNDCDTSSLTCIGTNDDFCGTSSSVSWLAQKGINYFIFVSMKDLDIEAATNTFLPAANDSTSRNDENTFDFVLTVDHEENGSCYDSIGPIKAPFDNVITGSISASSKLLSSTPDSTVTCTDVDTSASGDVWYTVQGTGDWMRANTCHNLSSFEARLDVTEGACDDTRCVAVRDSNCVGNGYQIIWKSEQDTTYNLMVFKADSSSGSVFGLSVENFEPVANHRCDGSLVVEADGSMLTSSTSRALFNMDLPACGAAADKRLPQQGVWYRSIGTGNTMIASTCHPETNFATEVSLFTTGGSCLEDLECVQSAEKQYCLDDKGARYWQSVEGQEYLIYVHGVEQSVGDFGLTVSDFDTEENDVCAEAITMDLVSVSSVTGSTVAATVDSKYPFCSTTDEASPSVWYKIVGTGDVILASTCDSATTFDTKLTIFTGDCEGNLTCVVSDDNNCGLQTSVAWSTEVGVTYYILVHGGLPSSVGDFGLKVKEYNPNQSNDFCDSAELVKIDGKNYSGSTVQATYDNVGECANVPNTAPGVWYQTVGTGRRLKATACQKESIYKSAITVLEGSCLNQTCVAANADSEGVGCSQITWLSTLEQVYYLVVHGDGEESGNFTLSIEEEEIAVDNDFCVDAFPISPSTNVVQGSTLKSTHDEVQACMHVEQTGYGVWYSVVGTGRRIIASTCSNTPSDFDTKISVFTGSNCGNLTCAVADDNGCGKQSRAVWRTESGVQYYILVHGPVGGQFGLVVDEFVPALANDFCSAAQGPMIPNGGVAKGSTYDSSFDDVGFCGADNTSPGVWFFTQGTGEIITADTCNDETDFDTKISIFTGPNCWNLSCVTGNDDGCGLQSSVSWRSEIGKFYFILLHGWGTDSFGNYSLTLSGSTFFD